MFYKPYPANHFTHAGIDAAMRLRERLRLEDIADIKLGVSTPTLRTIAQPHEQKAKPQSGYHAQFSGPFTVAIALIGGGGGLGLWLDDFTDAHVRDPRYLNLAARVRVPGNPECDALFPHQFPAVRRVTTKSGEVFAEKDMANRGGPGNPLRLAELRVRFLANASRRMDNTRAMDLADTIMDMENIAIGAIGAIGAMMKKMSAACCLKTVGENHCPPTALVFSLDSRCRFPLPFAP
ncbi:MAG: hypothetical protein ACKV2V_05950 [Blastocatellia bacterium]